MKRINVGSGTKPETGGEWVNIDAVDYGDNVVHDLNVYPWPFQDNQFCELKACDVLEHLDNPVSAINEMIRICEPGARIYITVPNAKYPEYAWTDPQHKRPFSVGSLDFWVKGHRRELSSGRSHHMDKYFIDDLKAEEINRNVAFTFRKAKC